MLKAFDWPKPLPLTEDDSSKATVRTDGRNSSILIHIRERAGFYVRTKSGRW